MLIDDSYQAFKWRSKTHSGPLGGTKGTFCVTVKLINTLTFHNFMILPP